MKLVIIVMMNEEYVAYEAFVKITPDNCPNVLRMVSGIYYALNKY